MSSLAVSTLSNVRLFRSFHTVHMRHKWTTFQISEECFPNQFHHPHNKSTTAPGKTQWIPKVARRLPHNPNTVSQCSNKWATVSPLHLHIQHQLTKHTPLLRRLSWVKILPQAAIHTKKNTLLRAFKHQMLFHGKGPVVIAERALQKEQTSNLPLPCKLQLQVSGPTPLGKWEYMKSKKEVTESSSQSWKSHKKRTLRGV